MSGIILELKVVIIITGLRNKAWSSKTRDKKRVTAELIVELKH